MNQIKVGDLFFVSLQDYGNTIYQCVHCGEKCKCGDNDLCTMQIVCNNNFGLDQTTLQFHHYNQHKGKFVHDCQKNIYNGIRSNIIKKFSEAEAERLKCKLIENEEN